MNINDTFPSKYLKASDLQGHQIKVVISRVSVEKLGEDERPVVYFENKAKGVVLNRTNASVIQQAYGDDTDDWTGCEIVLFEAMVDYKGKIGPAIRMRVPPRKPAGKAPAVSSTVAQISNAPHPHDDMNDEVPF